MGQDYGYMQTFNTRDGLPSNNISGLEQDSRGLLWIATWNGLCCFDGYRFTTFRSPDDGHDMLTTNRIDKIRNQYRLLGQALGVQFEDGKFYDAAKKSVEELTAKHGAVRYAVGECVNADSFELALALTEYGHKVSEIYGTVGERNFFYIKKLAELSPDTRIFTNLSPTMLNYERKTEIDVTIGVDAGYYHPDLPNVPFNDEEQPFGYEGVSLLAEQLSKALEKEGK